MLVVNLYGAPGVGKSTAASYIFYKLKSKGISCELVTEVAKDLCWEDNKTALSNQLYVAGNQSYRLSRLEGKVDVVVTDAPIMLQPIYYKLNKKPREDLFGDLMYEVYNQYENINIIINYREEPIKEGRVEYNSKSIQDIIMKVVDALGEEEICIIDDVTREDNYDYILDKIYNYVEMINNDSNGNRSTEISQEME